MVKIPGLFQVKEDRLHGLDHLRAIAIILVMVFHFGMDIPAWLEPVRKIGWTGVDLFFVLSGYLIGYQLLREIKRTETLQIRKFYIKRFFRIIPVYLVVLVIYYSLPNFREGAGMPPVWRFLTFTQNFGLDAEFNNSFSHAWSLCIEEQFYLLLPISILLLFSFKLQRFSVYLFSGLFLLGFILRYYNWYDHVQPFIDMGKRREMVFGFIENVYYPTYNRMDGLLIGVGIASIFNFWPKLKEFIGRYGNYILLLGLFLLIGSYFIFENFISFKTAIFGFPLISLSYGVLVMAAISPTSILYKLKSRVTLIIATLSYSIYLTHKLLFHITKLGLNYYNLELSTNLTFLICVIVSGLGGLILYIVVEVPFLRLRKVILKKK